MYKSILLVKLQINWVPSKVHGVEGLYLDS